VTSRIIGIFVILTFMATAAPQAASASDARETYFRCLATQTVTLDDGRSPVETVALTVVSACLSEGRAMYLSSPDSAKVLERYDTNTLRDTLARFAARVVERYRKSRK
jgi:hypothetical protein